MLHTQAIEKDTREDTPKFKKTVRWATKLTMRSISMLDKEEKVATFKRQCKIMALLAQDVGSEVIEAHLGDTCRGMEYFAYKSQKTQQIIRRHKAWGAVPDE
jgi:hypothetical protein